MWALKLGLPIGWEWTWDVSKYGVRVVRGVGNMGLELRDGIGSSLLIEISRLFSSTQRSTSLNFSLM
jgi:hypothetical protein